jgi:predicted Zn-dependent peptidase
MPNRNIAPVTNHLQKLQLAEPESHKLDNGIPVFVFRNDQQQALKIDFIFNSGTAGQSRPLVANSAIRLLKEGTKSYPGNKLMQHIDFYGSYISQYASKDESDVTMMCLKKDFQQVIPFIESMLKEPSFVPKAFGIIRNITKEEFIIRSEKPKNIALKAIYELVFGNDTPYGVSTQVNDYDTLRLEDLKDFYRNNYGSNNCYIILSGPIDHTIMNLVHQHIGSAWNADGKPNDFNQVTYFKPTKEHIIKKDALQSAIQIGMPMVHRTHADFIPFQLLNILFGGYFGSRLMSNIREDKGYTYGIHSNISAFQQGSIFTISTETGSAVTQATMEEIQKEMKILQNETISTEELDLVKNYLSGSYMRSLDGVYNQAEKFKSIQGFALGMDYYEKSLQKIQQTQQDELKELANKYLNYDAMTTVIVGA